MKKHLGTTKVAAHAHSIFDMACYDPELGPSLYTTQNIVSKLEKKVGELTKQVEK